VQARRLFVGPLGNRLASRALQVPLLALWAIFPRCPAAAELPARDVLQPGASTAKPVFDKNPDSFMTSERTNTQDTDGLCGRQS